MSLNQNINTMDISYAEFMGSWERNDQIPQTQVPEFAFIGRSNVGKSSLINMLCNRKKLAKTSSTPGKTQLINLFKIEKRFHFCDLPGYGYAKVSKTKRDVFNRMINHYLRERQNLFTLFILLDMRVEMQELDVNFINWCGTNEVPFTIVGTKCDALKPKQIEARLLQYEEKLSENWAELPTIIPSSSKTKMGKDILTDFIFNGVKSLGI
jgi:GTP-binding protein